MVAPGRGIGNQRSAEGRASRAIDILKAILFAFPNGSKESQAIYRAIMSLNPLFGTRSAGDTGEAANHQMSQMGTQPNPQLAGAPSPGPQLAPLPPRQIGQAAMGAGPTGMQ
jgi:hypothetical protein